MNNQNFESQVKGACGIIGIISFFLPFFSIDVGFTDISVSGYASLKGLINSIQLSMELKSFTGASGFGDISNMPPGAVFVGIVMFFLYTGPFVFMVKSIKLLVSAVKDTDYDCGVKYAYTYLVVLFLVSLFIGAEIKQYLIFFNMIGIGFFLTYISILSAHYVINGSISRSNVSYVKEIRPTFNNNKANTSRVPETDESQNLPQHVGCPFCHTLLELDRDEQIDLHFFCPKCKRNVDLRFKNFD